MSLILHYSKGGFIDLKHSTAWDISLHTDHTRGKTNIVFRGDDLEITIVKDFESIEKASNALNKISNQIATAILSKVSLLKIAQYKGYGAY